MIWGLTVKLWELSLYSGKEEFYTWETLQHDLTIFISPSSPAHVLDFDLLAGNEERGWSSTKRDSRKALSSNINCTLKGSKKTVLTFQVVWILKGCFISFNLSWQKVWKYHFQYIRLIFKAFSINTVNQPFMQARVNSLSSSSTLMMVSSNQVLVVASAQFFLARQLFWEAAQTVTSKQPHQSLPCCSMCQIQGSFKLVK